MGEKKKNNSKIKDKEVGCKKKINAKKEKLDISENSVDVDSPEERPGVGYEIFGKSPDVGN